MTTKKYKKTKGLSKQDKKEILDVLETLASANIRLVISFEPKNKGVWISQKAF
jgi:hypothetical protein